MLNFEKIVTNHEILEIEKNAIKSGLKESILIERAGQKISEFLSIFSSNEEFSKPSFN